MRYKSYVGDRPCPGCDRPGYVISRPGGANALCEECKTYIKLGKGVKEEKGEFGTVEVPRITIDNIVLHFIDHSKRVNLDNSFCKGPKYISDSFDKEGTEGSSRRLTKALKEFLKSIDNGDKPYSSISHELRLGERGDKIHLEKDALVNLHVFIKELSAYSHRLYIEGFKTGKGLLQGLNNGDLTLKDFESKTP